MATNTRVQISFPNEGFNVNLIKDSRSATFRYFFIAEKFINKNDAQEILDILTSNTLERYFSGKATLKEQIANNNKYFFFGFNLIKSNIKDEKYIMDVVKKKLGAILKNKITSSTPTTPDPTPTPDPINQTSSSELEPSKKAILGVHIFLEELVLVNGVNQYTNYYKLYLKGSKNTIEEPRDTFFVVGDVIQATEKPNVNNFGIGNFVTFYKVEYINDDDYKVYLSKAISKDNLGLGFEKSPQSTSMIDLLRGNNIEIVQEYNLREVLDVPTLVPKTEEPTITQVSPMQEEIDQIKKDIGQLLFLRTLISPIEFEEKISIGQTIDEKQKKLNELTFKSVEDKFKGNSFFDELFEQSFTPIKHEYDGVYAENKEETNFFTPNGSRSDLSDALNEIIRTPEFINWFGDWQLSFLYKEADALEIECSKVLTDNFEPRIVWHGTGQEFSYFRFDTFPAAYFAVNREYSQFFADLQGGGNGYVIPFFLNVRNPLDLTHFGTRNIPKKDFFDYLFLTTGLTMEQLEVNPLFLSDNVPDLETWIYIRRNPKMLKKISESNLYDGIHFYESNPNEPDTSSKAHKTEAYIIFDANQCKIASPNRGLLLLASLKSFLLEKGGKI